MAQIVQNLITELDNAIHAVGETLFVDLAEKITPLAGAVLTVYMIWLGYRMVLGGVALRVDDLGQLFLRIFIIFSVGLYWQNFLYIYDLFSTATGEIAWSFFTSAEDAQGSTPAEGMDEFANSNKAAVNDAVRAQGAITRGVLGAILIFLMGLLQVVYVFVVAMSKIAIAVCVATAPLAFLCLLSERTKNLFEAWLQSIIAYSMYPIAAAATVGVLSTMLGEAGGNNPSSETSIESIMIFLVLMLLGKATLLSVPIMASNLTGHISLSSFSPDKLSAGGLGSKLAGTAGNKAQQFSSGFRNDGKTTQQNRNANQAGSSGDIKAAEAGRKIRQKLPFKKPAAPPAK